jgi:hypothetical protein
VPRCITEMLARSMEASLRAQAMGETMKLRSGLGVVTRKLFDCLVIHDWITQDLAPLKAAWSLV